MFPKISQSAGTLFAIRKPFFTEAVCSNPIISTKFLFMLKLIRYLLNKTALFDCPRWIDMLKSVFTWFCHLFEFERTLIIIKNAVVPKVSIWIVTHWLLLRLLQWICCCYAYVFVASYKSLQLAMNNNKLKKTLP